MVTSKPGDEKKPNKLKNKKKPDGFYRTVCCHLCVDEATRKFLWEAMERYTLLVNLLLEQVGQSPEFEKWKCQGWVPDQEVKKLCEFIKEEERFKGLPSRFYMSAQALVRDTFDGWVKLQQHLSRKVNGKKRWLKVVEEDCELAKTTDFSAEAIQNRAKEVLLELYQQNDLACQPSENLEDKLNVDQEDEGLISQRSIFFLLFERYEVTEDYITRRAIVHLLKNGGEVNEETEDPKKLANRLARKREEILRLEEQLTSRLPKGRDPTGAQAIDFLQEAIQLPEHPNCYPALFLFDVFCHYALLPIPYVQYAIHLIHMILDELRIVDLEFLAWQKLMVERLTNAARVTNTSFYPLMFGSTDDLYWSSKLEEKKQQNSGLRKPYESPKPRKRPSKRKRRKNQSSSREQIFVRFKGFGKYTFKVNCDRRQLPRFRLFVTDWQNYKKLSKEKKYFLALFVLRSAKLIWEKDKRRLYKKRKSKQANLRDINTQQGQELVPPWITHFLHLHCSIDPNLLTAEGTEKVRLRKIGEVTSILYSFKNKEQEILAEKSRPNLPELKRQELEDVLVKIRRKILSHETSLVQLNNSPIRPSKVPYEGEANIALGVSFCIQEIVGVAVVDLQTQKLLEYYSARKLLIKQRVKKPRRNRSLLQLSLENYRLISRLRKLSRRNLTSKQKQQKQGKYVRSKAESNLGQYLERLIATRVTQVALRWRANSIVIPELEGMREYIESAVQARAKQLFPKHREKQENYAKHFRIKGHRWSYRRIAEFIRSRTLAEGIAVKTVRQSGKGSLLNKALRLALSGCSSV